MSASTNGGSRPNSRRGPLDGIRILDLSIALTGPYAVALLADQGAEVIKVERPGIGDIGRWVGVSVNGMSALYLMCNRGKRGLAVDIHTDEGRAIVHELARRADVVVQNYRPGVVERLGIGYDDLRAVNPDLVYASLSGFGPVGPYAHKGAYDTVIQAYGGLASSQATRRRASRCSCARPRPTRSPRSTRHRRSRLRCSRVSAARAASTCSSRCSTRWCRSCGPTRGERGAARIRRLATLELRADVPAVAVHRRLGGCHPDVRRRLRRDVSRVRRRRLRRPTRRDDRRTGQASGRLEGAHRPLLRCGRAAVDWRRDGASRGRASAVRRGGLARRALVRPHARAIGLLVDSEHPWSGRCASRATPLSSRAPRPTSEAGRRRWGSTPTRSWPSSGWATASPTCGLGAWLHSGHV